MDVLKQAEQLRRLPMLSSLDAAQLKLLAFTSEVYEYTNDDYLFHQDEVSDSVFVILEGEVDVLEVSSGTDVRLASIGANELIGELAVLRKERRSASVRANGNVVALKISNDRFLKLIVDNPDVVLYVLKDISSKLAHANQKLVAMQPGS